MPVYDYDCTRCGPFTELRPMAECEAPLACPSGHGPGCSCCSGGARRSRTAKAADGKKSFPSARPWMISH
jgi:putative FmdB family regulatory protein